MYASLGDITFQGLEAFNSLSRIRATRWAEISLISNKAVLQNIGQELQSIDISIRLHRQFTDPAAKLSLLDEYRSEGTILPLVAGNGEFLGNYVITSISDTPTVLDTDGSIISVNAQISLKEYIDFNPERTRRIRAQREGFAISGNTVAASTSASRGTTPEEIVSLSITEVRSNSTQGLEFTAKAVKNPDQKNFFLNKATIKFKEASEGLASISDQISENVTLAGQVPQMASSVTAVGALIGNLLTSIKTGNLLVISADADLLSAGLDSLSEANIPNLKALITRR